MKKLCLYIGIICLANSVSGQNRLTDYKGTGSSLNFHLVEYEGEKYLLEINQEDIVKVFRTASIDSKVLLHEHYIPGMYTSENPAIHGDRIYYCQYDDFIYSFNYVENIVESYSVPAGYNLAEVFEYENQDLLSLNHPGRKNINLIVNGTGIINSVDSVRVVGFYGTHLLEEIISNQYPYKRDYVIHNISTGSVDTLFSSQNFRQETAYDDGLIYFVDTSSNLYRYNLNTQVKETIDEAVVEPENFGTSLLINNDTLIVESSNRIDSILPYQIDFHFYNIVTGEYLSKLEVFGSGVIIEFFVINDLLIGLTNNWELIILNHQTGQKYSAPMRGGIWKELIRNRYLLFINSDSWEIELFDAIDFKTVMLDTVDYYKGYVTSGGIIEGEDEVLILLNDVPVENRDFFRLDLNSMTLINDEFYDISNDGFSRWAETFEMEEGIFIAQNPCFLYSNNELNGIQGSQAWKDFKYDVNSKIVFARSKSENMIYRYDGDRLDSFEVASIVEYLPTSNSVYYRSSDNEIFSYDLATQKNVLIDQNVVLPYFQLRDSELHYRKEQEFYKYTSNAGLELVVNDLANNLHVIRQYPVDSMGNMFIPTTSGVLEYGMDGSLRFIKKFSFFNSSNSYFYQNNSRADLIFGNRDSLFHYDGTVVHSIETGKLLSHPNLIGNRMLWINDWDFLDEQSIGHSLYNLSDHSLKELDIEGTGRPSKYFEVGGHQFLFFTDYPRNKVRRHRLFKVDDNFDIINEGLVRLGNYINQYYWHQEGESVPYYFDKNAIFAFGDYFLEINENGDYNFLDAIREKSYSTNFHNIDDQICFLAYDPLHGRQLYCYASDFTKVIESDRRDIQLSLYPNPTHGYLRIKDIHENDFDTGAPTYRIITVDGKELDKGQFRNEVIVEHLTPGVYFIQVALNGSLYTGKFVKV